MILFTLSEMHSFADGNILFAFVKTVLNLIELLISQKQSPRGVLKNFAKFTGKRLCQSIFFNKVADLRPADFIKRETVVQVFSCEFCEIFKNIFFYRTPLVTASDK